MTIPRPVAATLFLLAQAASAQAAPKFTMLFARNPPELVCADYVIDRQAEHNITIVVYAPKAPGIYPAILDVHGGGWRERQVEHDRPLAEALAARGFVVAIVDYRLSIEARYPAAVWDCKTAIRYLRAHAAALRLNPAKIGVIGGSAGGHLAALVGTTNGDPAFEGPGPDPQESSAVSAVVVMAMGMDLQKSEMPQSSSYAVDFFGVPGTENPQLYHDASPLNHVSRATPPMIFIEGEKDSPKFGRAEMQARMRELGIETKLYTLKDAPHPFWMSHPWMDQTAEIAAEFFHRQLDPQS